MTNSEIIFIESVKLMNEGVIKGTGQFIEMETSDGTIEIEIPEAIHTYATWKQLGYQVQKGEKAIAQFTIWKAVTKEDKESKKAETKMFMKKSSFFKASQVAPIA